jgi:hypothetical protein
MKRIVILAIIGWTIFLTAACPTPATDDTRKKLKDAGDAGSLVVEACNNLRTLQCTAGNPEGSTCETVLGKIVADRLSPIADNLPCVIGAKSKTDVRRCPQVECP